MNEPRDSSHIDESSAARSVVGSMLLLLGVVLLVLSIVDRSTTGLPFTMPDFWYRNQKLWSFFAIITLMTGGLLLRRKGTDADGWKPSQPGARFQYIVLYTRDGCHLCDKAKETLLKYARYLPAIEEIDVNTDRALAERFGTCIPVVEIDGKIRFRGHVNDSLLRRLIEATPPQKLM